MTRIIGAPKKNEMIAERLKFALVLFLVQGTLLWMFALFGGYDVDADASDIHHSHHPAWGGYDPDKNPIRKFYPGENLNPVELFLIFVVISVPYVGEY